jgi:hypothetical protein
MIITSIIIALITLVQVSNSKDKIPQVVVFDNELYIKKMKMDVYNLIDAKLRENDILSTVVSYSGGCEKHEFTLGAIPGVTNTDSRLHANLVLGHENNGDTCKKIVRERLDFDLSPLKEKYRQVYGVKAGSIILQLINKPINIKYNFK